jgi:N-acetylmuramoyl-L-alanine amidase
MTDFRHRRTNQKIGTAISVCFVVLVFLFPVIVCAAENSRITDIRFWQSPEEAQIVLDMSATPRVSAVNKLKDGTLYFDIRNSSFRPGRQRYPLKNPFIDVLTVKQRARSIVRVFFRVPRGVEAKTFVLPKNLKKSDRIVIFLREPQEKANIRRQAEIKEVSRLKSRNVKIVVLDPGHGGEDPGTRNNGIIEKKYVMAMGKLIKAYFDRDPRFKAVLTRNGDYIIPLERRREIAERLGADAFISLHVNYNRKKKIRGIEVYYESPRGAVGEAERLVAEMENQVDFSGSYRKAKKKKAKKTIVKKQASIMFKSEQLASKVETRLNKSVSSLPSRGVKRAGFKVLHSMAMPSVLVEFGYTSNRSDVKILKNYTYRTKLAQGLYLGVRDFLLNKIKEGYDKSYIAYINKKEKAKLRAAKRRASAAKRRKKAKKRARKYKVRRGDTLSGLAKKYKVSVTKICKLNKFSSRHMLKIGQIIYIPRS